MAIADTPHSRYMTAKFGSGLASRADAAGNHTLSTTVMDAYAQSGQAVPAELATQIQELNSITQNEAMLSQSSPSARAALAAGSYDPIATRNRAAQLEQQILSSSATARNAGAAAELQINQQRALELQLKNQMTQDTFGAARDANISTLSLQAEQARDQLTTIEDGRSLRTATDFVYQNGATVDDLYAAYSANDPAIMQQVFGTTDRRVAHGVLQAMQIDQSADTKLRLDGMKDATRLQALQLLDNPDMTPDQITAMSIGQLDLPEGVSRMAVDEAMRELTETQNARNALATAQAQGIQDQAQLAQMAVASMTQAEMTKVLAQTIQNAGGDLSESDLMELATTGDVSRFAGAILSATNGGTTPIVLQTPAGAVQVAPQDLLNGLVARQEQADLNLQQKIYTQALESNYAAEVEEQVRVTRSMEGLLGAPLTGISRVRVDAALSGASAAYKAAARATTPEERGLLENEGMRMFETAREMVVEEAKQRGVPEAQLEDIRQGRFMSDETFGMALTTLLDPNPSSGLAAQAVSNYLVSKGATPEQLKQFATNPTLENIGEIGAGIFSSGVSLQGIQAAVHDSMLNAIMTEAVMKLEGDMFAELPDDVRQVFTEAIDFREGPFKDIPPVERFGRLMQATEVAESMMVHRDPNYVRGSIRQLFSDSLNADGLVKEVFAPNGRMTPEGAAIATLYLGNTRDIETSGPNAIAFEQLLPQAGRAMVEFVNGQQRGMQYTNLEPINAYVTNDTNWLMERAGMYNPQRASITVVPQDDPAMVQYKADQSAIADALRTVYMRKIMDPSIDRTTIGGVPMPSLGATFSSMGRPFGSIFEGGIANDEDIIATLRANGNTDLANRLETGKQ